MRDGLIFLPAVGRGVLPLSLALLGWNARYAGARGRRRVCPVTLRCRLLRFAVKNGLITTMPCHIHTVARPFHYITKL